MSETRQPPLLFQQIEPGIVLAGRYRILSSIGKGGMGFVYAAQEESLGIKRMVAIKVMPPQMMMDEGLLRRFREEIKIASGLDHPNIVPIYSLGEHHGVYFYVMKLLDGATAYQKLHKDGPFAEAEVRRLIAPIARALHYAHSKGVIHRDVKSNNIHISVDGFPTLMDFGIARGAEASELTLPGQVVGTAEYMSPEQWYGEVDGRSDIYSLGIVLFELATGQLPFRSKHTFELMKLHQEVPAPSPRSVAPQISPALERLILKCIAKDPAARFATAQLVAEALESPYDPNEVSAAVEIVAPAADGGEAPLSGSHTLLQESPVAELTGADKKVWHLCVQADEAYASGQIDVAIKLIGKAGKLSPDSNQVATRRTKYTKMKELTEQILARARKKLADGYPKQAIVDCENVLRCIPSPSAVALINQAQRQIAEAEKLVEKAQQLRAAGKIKAFTKSIAAAQRLNAELEYTSGTAIRPRPQPVKAPKPVKKKTGPPIFTRARVIGLSIFIAVVVLVLGIKPGLLYLADSRFIQNTEDSLFLSPASAYQLYKISSFLGFNAGQAEERLRLIQLKAKNHYVNQANQAVQSNDLGLAVEMLNKALKHDPTDAKLRDTLDLLQAKYQVQKSIGK
ncbi:MAG: serine/threonine protein kinase [Myxococcales bacterium]|nr:serine/threonine protein kinase [Myxococcales bacterium]